MPAAFSAVSPRDSAGAIDNVADFGGAGFGSGVEGILLSNPNVNIKIIISSFQV